MTVSYINTILFIVDLVKANVRYTTLTITKNSFMHIKLEAAVLRVGVKTYSSEGPSQFETHFFCDPITIVVTIIVTSLSQ